MQEYSRFSFREPERRRTTAGDECGKIALFWLGAVPARRWIPDPGVLLAIPEFAPTGANGKEKNDVPLIYR